MRTFKIIDSAIMLAFCLALGFLGDLFVSIYSGTRVQLPNKYYFYILGGIGFFFFWSTLMSLEKAKHQPWRRGRLDRLISGFGIICGSMAFMISLLYIMAAPFASAAINSGDAGTRIALLTQGLYIFPFLILISFLTHIFFWSWHEAPSDRFIIDKSTNRVLAPGEKYRILWPADYYQYSIQPHRQKLPLGRFWVECEDKQIIANFTGYITIIFDNSERHKQLFNLDGLHRAARVLFIGILEVNARHMPAAKLLQGIVEIPGYYYISGIAVKFEKKIDITGSIDYQPLDKKLVYAG